MEKDQHALLCMLQSGQNWKRCKKVDSRLQETLELWCLEKWSYPGRMSAVTLSVWFHWGMLALQTYEKACAKCAYSD